MTDCEMVISGGLERARLLGRRRQFLRVIDGWARILRRCHRHQRHGYKPGQKKQRSTAEKMSFGVGHSTASGLLEMAARSRPAAIALSIAPIKGCSPGRPGYRTPCFARVF